MGGGGAGGDAAVPLLEARRRSSGVGGGGGGATWAQTLVNVVVSIVGTGVLGLPYAFRIAGWAAGSLGVAAAGLATYYCMTLLVGLCVALAFTFPVMMHPIHEIAESRLKSVGWFQKVVVSRRSRGWEWAGLHLARLLAVAAMAVLASFVPGFGAFISFVGSTVCALLSFVLPAAFHLKFLAGSSSLGLRRRALDYALLILGLVFAAYGTYAAVVPGA